MDWFQNAVDTVGSTLTFFVLYAIVKPDVKRKVQEEIDFFLTGDFETSNYQLGTPLGGIIIYFLKFRLPYTFAFVLETMRFSCALPIIAPRVATVDIKDGFHIKAVPENVYFYS